MTFDGGYLTLGRLRGAPVRVHWSAPLGAFFFGQFRFVPGFWVAFIGLILAHEIGHALMVLACGARVRAVDVTGLGGQCHYDGAAITPLRRALIAWGGVLAQLAVLVVAGALLLLLGPPQSAFLADIADACISYNLMLMALNLLPFGGLDGREAWKILPLLRGRWQASRRRQPAAYEEPPVAKSSPRAGDPLPRTNDPALEVQRLKEILERSPRRR